MKIKQIIKKTPVISSIAKRLYLKLLAPGVFKSSDYWEMRYKNGGNSGDGSYNVLAEYKAKIINKYVKSNNVKTIIEYGCGDGNQLALFNFKSYVGFDVSKTIILKCQKLYSSDNSKIFKTMENYNYDKAELTIR